MKICWDNLENIHLTKNGIFLKNNSTSFVYINNCVECNEPYLMHKHHPTFFCSKSCRHKGKKNFLGKKHSEETKQKMSIAAFKRSESKEYIKKLTEAQKGDKGNNWKGGVSKLNLPLYDTYAHQLWIEETRYIFKKNLKLLEVKCIKCKSWFVPTIDEVQRRMKFLNNKTTQEGNFYCSEKCKTECSIFGQILYPKNFKNKTNKEYTRYELSVWSNEVIQRANYTCEYCGEKAEHAHHIKPKKLEPFFALDPDYGVSCCKKCHYKYGHVDDCSISNLMLSVCG